DPYLVFIFYFYSECAYLSSDFQIFSGGLSTDLYSVAKKVSTSLFSEMVVNIVLVQTQMNRGRPIHRHRRRWCPILPSAHRHRLPENKPHRHRQMDLSGNIGICRCFLKAKMSNLFSLRFPVCRV